MARPARRSIDEVALPYTNFLINVPRAGEGVCRVCHGPVYGGYPMCHACHQAKSALGALATSAVSFVSLAPAGEQLARDLYTYKRESVPATLRGPRLIGLAAVLWKWLSLHEGCVAAAAGLATSRFDLVTSVPSTSGRSTPHPLEALVSQVVAGTGERYRSILELNRTDLPARQVAVDRYRAGPDVAGASVLVIDDTWTTGAHAQSAGAALAAAGAGPVAVLALGRWFTSEFRDNPAWLARHRQRRWDWADCCLHNA